MCITVGSLLQRLEREPNDAARFAFFMPRSHGPCRFGVYNLLHKMVLEQEGWRERVRVWSPLDGAYGDGLPSGLFALAAMGFITIDFLLQGLHDVRPVEASAGAAEAIYRRHVDELVALIRDQAARAPTQRRALLEAAGGRLFGCAALCRRAARTYAAVKTPRAIPTVAVVGEIYVRCDPFANDFVIDKLEARGIRARLAPFNEWLEYLDWCRRDSDRDRGIGSFLSQTVLRRSQQVAYDAFGRRLGWPPRTRVGESLAAAAPYLRTSLYGEAVLTIGAAVHEWRSGHVDGVVNVGPLECMPSKLAEAQFFHAAEHDGLPSITIPLNGDPIDPEVLDHFAFAVHEGFRRRSNGTRLDRHNGSRQGRRNTARAGTQDTAAR